MARRRSNDAMTIMRRNLRADLERAPQSTTRRRAELSTQLVGAASRPRKIEVDRIGLVVSGRGLDLYAVRTSRALPRLLPATAES
jgi:hypothetical protein